MVLTCNNGERRFRLLNCLERGGVDFTQMAVSNRLLKQGCRPLFRHRCYQPYPRTPLQFIKAINIAGLHTNLPLPLAVRPT